MFNKTKEEPADGTCLKDTMKWCWKLPKEEIDDWRIIHAMVERKSDRLRHPHAVVYNVKTQMIYEVSNDFKENPIICPFIIWMRMGNISDMKNWKIRDLTAKNLETMTWGFHHLLEKGIINL